MIETGTAIESNRLLCRCQCLGLCRIHGGADAQREMVTAYQAGDAPWRIARRHGIGTDDVYEVLSGGQRLRSTRCAQSEVQR